MTSQRIIEGDALEQLRLLPAGTAQTCITSPPYFGLRDYGTGEWAGGDPACQHVKGELRRGVNLAQSVHSTRGGAVKAAEVGNVYYGARCERCGAARTDRQLGLETTPDAYAAALVEVFREVRRVLRDDGTLWLNLGDSYATGAGKVGDRPGGGAQGDRSRVIAPMTPANRMPLPGLKPKDLIGIPWMVAFALRADGWWLRSDVIWAKPNPMPESVTDRPTKSHEYLFLLTKSARYFYDADAIREPATDVGIARESRARLTAYEAPGQPANRRTTSDGEWLTGGRNKRTVWTVATQPYAEAHFATFPTKLIEPCVLAGAATGALVLDPFAGSGTVGVVCGWHGREFVGVELNPAYAAMARRRIQLEGRPGRRPSNVPDVLDGQMEFAL